MSIMATKASNVDGTKLVWPSAVIISVIIATATLVHVADEFRTSLANNTSAIEALTNQMGKMITRDEYIAFQALLRTLNPNLKLPDPPR